MQETILNKYMNERLPRYTSYPTAPNFSNDINADCYRDWLSKIKSEEDISLYIHIPFCRSMCWYCGCHTKITKRNGPIDRYLEALKNEIITVSSLIRNRNKVSHIHFGGGTPTIVQPDQLLNLMNLLNTHFDVDSTAEIAIEIDPRTLKTGMIRALGEANITRASLGVQSFDPVVQKAINRVQTIEETQSAVSELRNVQIKGINFDLIYGLPFQDVESCITTVKQAVAMRPDRFSVFGYAHVPSFKKHQNMIDENALADGNERYLQSVAIAETLTKLGYQKIGLDHFALPDDDLTTCASDGELRRNFQGYTTDSSNTLIGLGASSIGRLPQGYVQNEVAIGKYIDQAKIKELPVAKGYALTKDDNLRAEIIERLMCDFEVDINLLCDRYGICIEELSINETALKSMLEDGLITFDNGKLSVLHQSRFIIRNLCSVFDVYLESSKRTFSRAA